MGEWKGEVEDEKGGRMLWLVEEEMRERLHVLFKVIFIVSGSKPWSMKNVVHI